HPEVVAAEVERERLVVVVGKDRRDVIADNEAVGHAFLHRIPQNRELDSGLLALGGRRDPRFVTVRRRGTPPPGTCLLPSDPPKGRPWRDDGGVPRFQQSASRQPGRAVSATRPDGG